MSLLMEALRKAEAAKREAARNLDALEAAPVVAEAPLGLENLVPDAEERQPEAPLEAVAASWQDAEFELELLPLDQEPLDTELLNTERLNKEPAHAELVCEEAVLVEAAGERSADELSADELTVDEIPATEPADLSSQELRESREPDEAGSASDPEVSVVADEPSAPPLPVVNSQASEMQRRSAARAVFAAKQNGRTKSSATGSRSLLRPLAATAAFVLLSGSAVLYWMLQDSGSGIASAATSFDASAVQWPSAVEEDTLGAAQWSVEQGVELTASSVDSSGEDSVVVPEQPVVQTDSAPIAEAPLPHVPDAAAPEVPVAIISQDTGQPADTEAARPSRQIQSPPTGIQFTRSTDSPRRNPQISSAYSAFQQGRYAAARDLYQQVLSAHPHDRDALLGLAASASRLGDAAAARELYARLLSRNPRDPVARAGLLESVPASDPVALETELKRLLETHPDVAALHFALGNAYAARQLWREAQQSFFEALAVAKSSTPEAVSPDYAFNLAISLERLNQPALALGFYQEALAQSAAFAPGFDLEVLRQRLNHLSRATP